MTWDDVHESVKAWLWFKRGLPPRWAALESMPAEVGLGFEYLATQDAGKTGPGLAEVTDEVHARIRERL